MDHILSRAALTRRTDEARPIVERLAAAGCRFVQMEAPDNNGVLRGKIAPIATAFASSGTAFAKCMLAVKGGGGICLGAPFGGLTSIGEGVKMVAVPDLSTAIALPWKADVAAVLCDYYLNDGTPAPVDPRHLLRAAESALSKLNFSSRVALEYEVYIVQENDALMRQGRFAELPGFGRGRDFYSISRAPSFEGLAKEFINRCEMAGIQVEAFHTEWGQGMFEYTFTPQTALKAADDSVRAKLYLKQLCSERGLAACYMAAKSQDTGDTFAGCHHNFSLSRDSKNAFWDESARGLSQVARYAGAGLLETTPAFSVMHRPWVNSYRRRNRMLGAPESVSWGEDNSWTSIRVVHGAVPERMSRFEYRPPAADVNPYLSIAALLLGCVHGIRESKEPPPYAKGDPNLEKHWISLPRTPPEAISLFKNSSVAAATLGGAFVEQLTSLREEEWKDFVAAVAAPEEALAKGPVTDWEITRYFEHA